MGSPRVALPVALLAGLSLTATGCGSASSQRQLQSMTLSPASADAQNFPNGQVQFVATGIFTKPPSPAPATVLNWLVQDPSIASVTQSGIAQCNAGAVGVTKVNANGGTAPCSGTGCTAAQILGSAQLTCP